MTEIRSWIVDQAAPHDDVGLLTFDRLPCPQDTLAAEPATLGDPLQPFPLGSAVSWRNVDLTDLELIRRTGPGYVGERQRAAAEADFTDGELEMMLGAGMTVLTRLVALDRFGLLRRVVKNDLRIGPSLDIDGLPTGERKRMALAALPPCGDVVLLWGALHLPDWRQAYRMPDTATSPPSG